MPQLSTLRGPIMSGLRSAFVSVSKASNNARNAVQVRKMGGGPRKMEVVPSQYKWNDVKDKFHFYVTLTAVPLGLFVAYMQIRIGPAKLVETPEGYVPEEHEYLKDPIQRWFKQYVSYGFPSHAKNYERSLFYLNEQMENQKAKLRISKVKELNTLRQDLRGWYFVPEDISREEDAYQMMKQKNSR